MSDEEFHYFGFTWYVMYVYQNRSYQEIPLKGWKGWFRYDNEQNTMILKIFNSFTVNILAFWLLYDFCIKKRTNLELISTDISSREGLDYLFVIRWQKFPSTRFIGKKRKRTKGKTRRKSGHYRSTTGEQELTTIPSLNFVVHLLANMSSSSPFSLHFSF